jgi:dienelactone hydrolase
MRSEEVTFYSEGVEMRGIWRAPADATGPFRTIVQGPGWLGLMDGANYRRYHEALCAAGYAVFIFDYRGSGASGGDRAVLSVEAQIDDLRAAVAYLAGRDDVGPLGCLGSGGTGGGNVFLLSADEARIRAAVSLLPVADGADWLRRMRSETAWRDFLAELDDDRRMRAAIGSGRLVDPRSEISIPSAERLTTTVKADVDGRAPSGVGLRAADELLRYRPVDAAARMSTPTLVVAVEHDDVTPDDHAIALHDALRGPKALAMLRHTTHYASYDQYRDETTRMILGWFDDHLHDDDIILTRSRGGARVDTKGGRDE